MDLYQLRYFLEVARELSFTRAAKNLFLSPPAVSRSVALLEASLKKKLFERTKRRVSLTAEGEFLKARVERIYDEIESARRELEAGGADRVSMLKIASREMITDYLLTEPMRAFAGRWPKTRFGLYELGPTEMAEALKKDEVHIGFYYAHIPDPALEVRHLGSLRSHIYGSAKAYPPGKRPRTFAEVLRQPFVAPRYFHADPAAPSPDGFPDGKYKRNIQFDAELLETHRRFVLDGIAVGVLPDLVIQEEFKKGRVVRFPGPAIFREIYFLKRATRPLPSSVDFFFEAVRRRIRDLGRKP